MAHGTNPSGQNRGPGAIVKWISYAIGGLIILAGAALMLLGRGRDAIM